MNSNILITLTRVFNGIIEKQALAEETAMEWLFFAVKSIMMRSMNVLYWD